MIKTLAPRPRIRRPTITVTARPARRAIPRVKTPQRVSVRELARPADAIPFAPHPYVDYARYLTAEGGIGIVYKDIDERWRFLLRSLCLWGGATGVAAWYLLHHSPIEAQAVNITALIVVGIVNWLIVGKPVQLYRTIEIRPDSMILDGYDIFWLRYMESWPTFGRSVDGIQVLSGTYGTRRVEYLKVRSFDDYDSTPTVLAAHLSEAMRQLWSWPY